MLLLAGLPSPARGVAEGVGSFGWVAAGLLIGSLAFVARLRRRAPSMLAVGVHATLAAYLSV